MPSKPLNKNSQLGQSHNGFPCRRRYVYCAMRNSIALFMLLSAFATGGGATESESVPDFYITITAHDLYLCGEGFGGMYGCIDEAVSREAKSVVIAASSDATVQAVHELVNAVHAVGFDQVAITTLNEYDT
jgi:hypothetical protein